MIRYGLYTLFSLGMLTAGCHSLKPTNAKLDAHHRWNHVRARVKHQLAEQQFEGGLIHEAARTVSESLALDPQQADAYVLLAKANLELGRPAAARQTLDAAGRAGVNSPTLTYLDGVLLELRDDPEAAVKRYAEAYRCDPTNVDFLVAQVECLVALDRADEATRLLGDAVGRLDDDATVPTLAAHVAAWLGDSAEASRQYRRAIEAGGESRLVAQELGILLVRSGRYVEALAVLTPLVESAAEGEASGAARRALAQCHFSLGDAKSAKRVLEGYGREHPDDALAQLLLAKAALATNDMMTALYAVDLVQRREPDRPELWLVRATLRWKRGELAGAASDLYDVLAADPNDLDAMCLLGEVLRSRRQFDAARRQFEQALQRDPQCAWAAAGLHAVEDAESAENEEPSMRLTSAAEPLEPVPPPPPAGEADPRPAAKPVTTPPPQNR